MPVDFSLICATHCKLREATEQGQFRSDLYYRINGLTVQFPALRERTDFDLLTQRLLLDLNPQRSIHVAADLLESLRQHPWPGNLRQYASALRTASAMLEPHEVCIDWPHLSDDLLQELRAPVQPVTLLSATQAAQSQPVESVQSLQELSHIAMRQALAACDGNVSQAARQLGISRQTLYRISKRGSFTSLKGTF
ncbi:acetoin catabolism regulatory protein [mine drainage metagenome]|uniref:Acetoin catabolism regulatory protein n=1 Tax=mine drainage metagenome TaxID=410659 RepID=A0A1J5Q333_9ZZZZ